MNKASHTDAGKFFDDFHGLFSARVDSAFGKKIDPYEAHPNPDSFDSLSARLELQDPRAWACDERTG
jgi:hypothetical protein